MEVSEAEEILSNLTDLSVLEMGKEAYSIHRLTQEAARAMDNDQAIGQKAAGYFDERVDKALEQGIYRRINARNIEHVTARYRDDCTCYTCSRLVYLLYCDRKGDRYSYVSKGIGSGAGYNCYPDRDHAA